MSDLRFKDGKRNVGLREYALIDDRLTAELIMDNHHITPELARMIVRCKGADRVCVVSDSLRCAGQPKDGRVYKLGSDEDAVRFVIGDGIAVVENSSTYAGSITPVRLMVKNLIDAGIPLVDAVKMGTLTPARIIGVDDSRGSLEVGKLGDVCILDDNFNLKNVFVGGKTV
jgi:N-acetylglucosamine-6-phosphate deacetylase